MFKVELHTHCTPGSGDAWMTPQELVQEHKKHGYDGIVVSNHFAASTFPRLRQWSNNPYSEWLDSIREAKQAGEELGIKVFAGMEYTIEETTMHVAVIGCTLEDLESDPIKPVQGIHYLRAWANKHNSILIHNHPFRDGSTPLPLGLVDGYECINSKPNENDIKRPYDICKEPCLLVCGGDVHRQEGVNTSYMNFFDKIRDERELALHIRRGNYDIRYQLSVVRPWRYDRLEN